MLDTSSNACVCVFLFVDLKLQRNISKLSETHRTFSIALLMNNCLFRIKINFSLSHYLHSFVLFFFWCIATKKTENKHTYNMIFQLKLSNYGEFK